MFSPKVRIILAICDANRGYIIREPRRAQRVANVGEVHAEHVLSEAFRLVVTPESIMLHQLQSD